MTVKSLLLGLLFVAFAAGQSLPVPATFYPAGPDHGDVIAPPDDDGSTGELPISVDFPFYGTKHSALYVNTNGVISFSDEVLTGTSSAFPLDSRKIIAPFWADVDTTNGNGHIYYRQTTDPAILARATQDVHAYMGNLQAVEAIWVFVATWYEVTYFYSDPGNVVNTFQTVLITDGTYSFAMLNYGDINWTTGDGSGGSGGIGGIPAQVGFNAGDGELYLSLPGARTADVINIEKTTNIGVTGRWFFQTCGCVVCHAGYMIKDEQCADFDECSVDNGGCSDVCHNDPGSYHCSCQDGYQLDSDQQTCSDIDECADDKGGCFCECHNDPGSYHCTCIEGWLLAEDQHGCIEVNECEAEVYPCSEFASCTNTRGSFMCACKPGYEGDGFNCEGCALKSNLRCWTCDNAADNEECMANPDNNPDWGWKLCDMSKPVCDFEEHRNDNGKVSQVSRGCKQRDACHPRKASGVCGEDEHNSMCRTCHSNGRDTYYSCVLRGQETFYPFGEEHGDTEAAPNDDGSTGIPLSVDFPFYGNKHTSLYINTNGALSFLSAVYSFTSSGFPLDSNRRIIAPFWADVDTTNDGGHIYYRQTTNPAILARATQDVRAYMGNLQTLEAIWVLVVTWYEVAYFSSDPQNSVNTFQTVLITDGTYSFAMFNYGDINWTTGDGSGGSGGIGGIPAQVGFNAGDGELYLSLPGSRTADIINIEKTTNVGVTGRWFFQTCGCVVCHAGYMIKDDQCADFDECSVDNGGCSELCHNDPGSYHCSCQDGYQLDSDQRTCSDIDECADDKGGCFCECHNDPGSYHCTCIEGWLLAEDQHGCIEVNECEADVYPCSELASCTNTKGSFRCECNTGYEGDGFNCEGCAPSQNLLCWTCDKAANNEECMANPDNNTDWGMKDCNMSRPVCEFEEKRNEVGEVSEVSRGCKQSDACQRVKVKGACGEVEHTSICRTCRNSGRDTYYSCAESDDMTVFDMSSEN